MKKIVLTVVIIAILFLGGIFIREKFLDISQYPPPPYFVENPRHEYTVKKTGKIYYVSYIDKRSSYGYSSVPVGNSDYDLSPYINKISIIEIDYPKKLEEVKNYTKNQQCIQKVCSYIVPENPQANYTITVNIKNIMPVTP